MISLVHINTAYEDVLAQAFIGSSQVVNIWIVKFLSLNGQHVQWPAC